MHSGPPFASGKAHLGHFFNMVSKDAVNRYKLMQGYRVHMLPGFDCHGLQIEDQALQRNSFKRDSLMNDAPQKGDSLSVLSDTQQIIQDRQKCKEYVQESVLK